METWPRPVGRCAEYALQAKKGTCILEKAQRNPPSPALSNHTLRCPPRGPRDWRRILPFGGFFGGTSAPRPPVPTLLDANLSSPPPFHAVADEKLLGTDTLGRPAGALDVRKLRAPFWLSSVMGKGTPPAPASLSPASVGGRPLLGRPPKAPCPLPPSSPPPSSLGSARISSRRHAPPPPPINITAPSDTCLYRPEM